MVENRFFETIKCDDYSVFNLDYHNKRIARSIGININLQEYIYPPSKELLKCKVIYNFDGIISIEYTPYIKKNISSFKLIYNDNITYHKKFLNRNVINTLKENISEDEIILIQNGLVTDTSIANIAIYHNNQWITPINPLLVGTTTSRYIDNGLIISKDIDVKMIVESKKIALLNAMIDFNILDNFKIYK